MSDDTNLTDIERQERWQAAMEAADRAADSGDIDQIHQAMEELARWV